jgi:nitrogen PTS system EIIA component
MEDILEQLVGSIEDEFEREAPLRLGDVLKESRILLDLKATTALDAIAEIINRGGTEDLPLGAQAVIDAVSARERSLPTYLGEGLGVPHARLDQIKTPVLFFARSNEGIVFDPKKPEERASVLFLLLTPGAVPRLQTRMLARIANLRESSYVWDRLLQASSRAEAFEAIRSGDELMT